jgi:ankyrin repeat protein
MSFCEGHGCDLWQAARVGSYGQFQSTQQLKYRNSSLTPNAGMVRDLLKAGAPVDSMNGAFTFNNLPWLPLQMLNKLPETRQTPLHVAVENNRVDISELLVMNGACVHIVTQPNMDTPLHLVKSIEIARILVESGASLASQNAWLQTPLHCACKGGDIHLMTFLISSGACLNAKDQQGRTPLHYCAAGNFDTAAKCLLEAGCVSEELDFAGCSALVLAEMMAAHSAAKVISAHQRMVALDTIFSDERS